MSINTAMRPLSANGSPTNGSHAPCGRRRSFLPSSCGRWRRDQPDEHFALMNQGQSCRTAGARRPCRMRPCPLRRREARKTAAVDGRCRGAGSAAATASMASTISRLKGEMTGKFLSARDLCPPSQFFDERSPLLHSICGNVKSRSVNVSRDRKCVVACRLRHCNLPRSVARIGL